MRNKSIKIGWAIVNIGLEHPSYRRRFGFYLKERNLSWEVANFNKSYDLVVVHHASDLTVWKNYNKAKVVFDYNDDYLAGNEVDFKSLGRGFAKFLTRQWSNLELNYKNAYIKMMQRADAVVCCTEAQKADAEKYCTNVHQIYDMQSDSDWMVKQNYDCGSTFNLVWEGYPGFEHLSTLAPTLRCFEKNKNCALHLITVLKYGKYLRNFVQINTKDKVKRVLNLNHVFLYEWNPYLFSHIASACDLAVIPINMNEPFSVSKPANKLIFFWRMAMPTLVAPTPEYIKLMNECGLDMVCSSPDEWIEKLERFSMSKNERQCAGVRAKQFVDENFCEQKLLAKWDSVLDSVL